MATYKPYPKYKNSNITWLGEIPEHWETIRLQHLFKEQDGRSVSGNEDLLSVSHYTGVTKRKERFNSGELITNAESLVGYKIVNPNDLVMNIMLAWNGSLGVSKYYGITSPAYAVFRPININEKYFDHILRTKNAQQEFKKHSTGIIDSRLRLYPDKFIKIKCILPPNEEQTAIARFLDYKLAKINRFIRKKKELIKLLNEQKAAIINQAVTKGLNPHAPMKDSGVEWLGEIPKHWKIVKLAGVCDFIRGNSSFKKDELLSNGKYVALQYGKTYKVDEVDKEYQFYVNEEFYKNSQIVNCGDVIIISTSETIEDLGHSVFYNRLDLGLLGGEQVLLVPKNDVVNGKYLWFSSKVFAKELKKYATGVKVYRFNISDLKTIYTPIPSIEEQQDIVSYIEKETAILNTTISTIEKEIALVEEYKTALIAEAVTGKIDVRGYAVPEVEMEEETYEELEEEMSMAAEDAADYETEETV
jgi:type I restriction enzyme, S subunit